MRPCVTTYLGEGIVRGIAWIAQSPWITWTLEGVFQAADGGHLGATQLPYRFLGESDLFTRDL